MKVKTRRGPGLTGSQKNYGLVTGSIWNYEDKPTSNNVGTTLSAVPRDEATIEAERGETVIGDLDNDGMVEHAKIGGKRHPQGGTPLNVPDGSFVFSDYRGLLIKNKDVLKNIFGMNTNKAVTPAKVAQRYEINKFKNMLNDPFIDPIDRKTAQLMIDNNMRKLGQLALIQEGMKGFPDGIPAIAMPLMGSDVAQQGGQQKMKKGGIVSYKKGGLAKYQGVEDSEVQIPLRSKETAILSPGEDPNAWQPIMSNWRYIGTDPVNGPVYENEKGNRIAKIDGNWTTLLSNVEITPSASMDYNKDTYNDQQDAAIQQQMMQNVFGDVNYQIPMDQDNGTISQTPDYKVPGTASYHLNNAFDIAMHPGSYLGYLMTPGDQGRFGAYLKSNTNPVNDVLDIMALRKIGLMPYLGGMYAQGKLQEKNEEAVQPKIGLSNLITGNMPQTQMQAGMLPSKFSLGNGGLEFIPEGSEFQEEHPGWAGAINTIGTGAVLAGTYALTRLGLKNAGILKQGLYSEGKPYFNAGLFKNSKGLYGAGRPYLETKLALRQAGKWSPFPALSIKNKLNNTTKVFGLNLKDKILGKNPGMYTTEMVERLAPGTGEFSSNAFGIADDIAQRTGRTKLIYNIGDKATNATSKLFNEGAGLRPNFLNGKSIWENANLYNMPYKDYFSKGNVAKRAWQAYKTPIVATGVTGGLGTIGAIGGLQTAKDKIPKSEIKKQQEQKPATFTGSTAYEDKKFRDWLVNELGVNLKEYDNSVDSVKNKYLELYKQNPNATFTIEVSNEADDVGGSVVPVKEEEKKEDKKENKVKEKKAEEKKKVQVTLPKKDKDEEFEELGTTRDTTGTYLRVKKKKFGGMLDQYDGENKSQVYTGSNTTIDRPESAIPTDWSGLSDYDILYAPEGQTGNLPNQDYNETLGYYTTTRDGKIQKIDLSDFYNRQSNILSNYDDGGIEGWKTASLSRDEATRKKAVGWFQREYDKWRESVGLPTYFFGQAGDNAYGIDELLGQYTTAAPGIVKKMKQEEKKEKKQKESKQEEDITIPPPNWQRSQTRYPKPRLADLMGEWGAAMQEIRRYPSMYAPINNAPIETIYDRFNPQALMGAYTTALQNAGTGPDSTRAIDNVTGKVLEGLAQGQEQVQTQVNNPRFMNMLAMNQQAKMKADAYNAAEAIRFQDDVSTKWQDYLANYNKKLANVTEKAATTAENQYKLALMKAMYPYANIDYDQSPTANATLNSITDEPVASSQGIGNFNSRVEQLNDYYRKQGYSKTEASKAALDHAKAELAYNKVYSGTAMSPFNIS